MCNVNRNVKTIAILVELYLLRGKKSKLTINSTTVVGISLRSKLRKQGKFRSSIITYSMIMISIIRTKPSSKRTKLLWAHNESNNQLSLLSMHMKPIKAIKNHFEEDRPNYKKNHWRKLSLSYSFSKNSI